MFDEILNYFSSCGPITDPILVFIVLMAIVLFAPLLANLGRLPDLVILLAFGALLGPNGLGVLERSTAVTLFGSIGLLYIMFLAGLEIDTHRFKTRWKDSVFFGLMTFLIPQICGTLIGHWILAFDWTASVLLASMFASHSLMAYPIASRIGISRSDPVAITVGATLITDTLALLVLAACADLKQGASLDGFFWLSLLLGIIVLFGIIWWGLPWVAKYFFNRVSDTDGAQFAFVILTTCFCAYLSHFAKMEPIIGAFLAGFVYSRLIPENSPLMVRIHFVGNTFFIPFFLISVGMLVDIMTILQNPRCWLVVIVMVMSVTLTKYCAAWITGHFYHYSFAIRNTMFGLSVAQAAATLAAVIVGYDLKIFDEAVLNGAIAMIVVTCPLGSVMVDYYGRIMGKQIHIEPSENRTDSIRHLLVSLRNPQRIESLIDIALAFAFNPKKNKIHALTVVQEDDENNDLQQGEKILSQALNYAAAANIKIYPQTRLDLNPSDGITRSSREIYAESVITGWKIESGFKAHLLGNITDQLIENCPSRLILCHLTSPLNTLQNIHFLLPPGSDRRNDIKRIFSDIKALAKHTGTTLHFYLMQEALVDCQRWMTECQPAIAVEYISATRWSELKKNYLARLKQNGLAILAMDRMSEWKSSISSTIPAQLVELYPHLNIIGIYDSLHTEVYTDSNVHEYSVFQQIEILETSNNNLEDAVSQLLLRYTSSNCKIYQDSFTSILESGEPPPVLLGESILFLHAHSELSNRPILTVVHTNSKFILNHTSTECSFVLVLIIPKAYSAGDHLQILADLAKIIHREQLIKSSSVDLLSAQELVFKISQSKIHSEKN